MTASEYVRWSGRIAAPDAIVTEIHKDLLKHKSILICSLRMLLKMRKFIITVVLMCHNGISV